MARCKACGRLPISANEHFLLALTVEELWADIDRNRFVRKGGGSLWVQILRGMVRRQPTTVGVRKLRHPGLSHSVVCMILRLAVLIQYRRVTDRRTDGHTMTTITAPA